MIPKSLLKKIKSLEIRTRYYVESMLSGSYQSAFKGRGLNFSDIRPYTIGDDVRFIDWKVTARTGGTPFVKLFQEERELTVMLMVDISGSQAFGSQGVSKRDCAIEVAAALGFSAIRNQDNVGLILFSDRIEAYVPPKKGKRHVLRLIRDLFMAKAVGKGTSISGALEYLLKVQKKRAIVFVISDFIATDYHRLFRIAACRHDVVPVVIEDPSERQFSGFGLMALEDAESGQVSYVSNWTWDEAEKEAAVLDHFFRSHKTTPIHVSTKGSAIDALIGFFKTRSKMRA